jgi:ATP-dependent Clp protease ATP-binding subunit ClpA
MNLKTNKSLNMQKPLALYDPVDIFNVATEIFPGAKAKINFDESQSFTFNIRLHPDTPLVSLSSGVDPKEFYASIVEMLEQINLNRVTNTSLEAITLDPSRFSLFKPLSNWQRFTRIMYENKYSCKCADIILSYLETSHQINILKELGLDPESIKNNLCERDLIYFRELFEKHQHLSQNEKTLFLKKLKQFYPNVYDKILEEKAQNELDEGLKKADVAYDRIKKELKKRVAGQEHAISEMAALLSLPKAKSTNQVYLYVGPTGVGKTELAKAVAGLKNDRIIILTMQQFTHESSITKLFGSSTGYLGASDLPPLGKDFERFSPVLVKTEGSKETYELHDVVIVFDELEKSHAQVKQSLLTLFDEGYCVFNYTKKDKNVCIQYNLKNCVLICTSNLFQTHVLKAFGQRKNIAEIKELFRKLNARATSNTEGSYSPEFLGRLEIIPFGPIPRGECYQNLLKRSIRHFLIELTDLLECREIVLENEQSILEIFEKKLYREGIDLRQIKLYLLEIRNMIIAQKSQWGTLKTKKLTLSSDDQGVYIKVSTFLAELNVYHDTPVPPLRLESNILKDTP